MVKCPNCGNDNLDNLGTDMGTGDTKFGCPICHITFTLHSEEYNPDD